MIVFLVWAGIVLTISLFAWFAARNSWVTVIAFCISALMALPALHYVRGEPLQCDLSTEHEIAGYILTKERVLLLLHDPIYCWVPYTDEVAEELQQERPENSKLMIGPSPKGNGSDGGGVEGESEEPLEITVRFPKGAYTK